MKPLRCDRQSKEGRSKEDTWGASELTSQLQDVTRQTKSRDKAKHREGEEKKHRSREKQDDEKRPRESNRERSSKDKRGDDGSHRRDDRGTREKSSRDERHKNREGKDKHRDADDNRDRERRKEGEDKEKRSSSHREKEDDRHRNRDSQERKERSHRDEERRERRSEKERKRVDHERDEEKHREKREKREERHRDENREDRHRDEDRHGKSRDKHRDKRDKDGKRHKEKDGEKVRNEDEDEARRQRRRERREKDEEGKTARDEEKSRRHKDKDREERHHRDDKRHHADEKRHHRDEKRHHKEDKEHEDSSGRDKLQRDEDYEEERRRRKEEKRRERKQREEEEREKERERQKSKTFVKEEIKADSESEIQEAVEEPSALEPNGYDYDDDDFEDYEDDFEDEDETEEGGKPETDIDDSTIAELRQAMEAENQASSLSGRDTGLSVGESSRGSTRPATSTRKTFINFVAAKQRQISNSVAQKTRKRGQELMKLIELDTVTFDLFDMPPVRDYERFIQHFGRSDTTQAIVQCNDDNLERDTQTDEIENSDKWCQHPPEGVQCCGGDGEVSDDNLEVNINQEAYSLKLTQFIEAAGQLMVVLLEESRAEHDGGALQSNQRSIVFSEGYTQLKPTLSFLKARSILQVQVHPVQTHLVLALYGEMKVPADNSPLSSRGILCVWNINDPSQPQKILSCRSQARCCSWSPIKATMVFAGTVDGSLVVWDLREPSNMHCYHIVDGVSLLVRVPTFSTDGILTEESHNSSVVALLPIVTAEDNLRASMPHEQQRGGSDTSFQLASLEESGVMYFWVVLEIAKTSQAGSESELGLVPGGRVKLIWSSAVSLNKTPSRDISLTSSFKAVCVQLNPQDPNQFYVGTDAGFVLHASRHHENVYPKIFRAHYDVPVEVTHLDFSPFALSCFLVACADGTIRLHSTMYELPLLHWPNSSMGMEVTSISWSHSRPSVFFSADATSKVYVWSLLEKDANPVKTEQFDNGRLTSLSVSNDYSASSMGRPGRRPELVIGDEKGRLEVHRLNERFAVAPGDELDAMSSLLQSFM